MAIRSQIHIDLNSSDPISPAPRFSASLVQGAAAPAAAAARSEHAACIHEQGVRAVYSLHYPRIHSLSVWMTPSPDRARELAQRVFLEACRRPALAMAAPPWLEVFAAQFRPLFDSQGPAEHARWLGLPPPSDLRSAVQSLPPAQRLVYLLHEVEGCPLAALAAWLRTDASLCARLFHAARLHLRLVLLAA